MALMRATYRRKGRGAASLSSAAEALGKDLEYSAFGVFLIGPD